MAKIVEIQLGEHRGVQSFDLNNIECDRNDLVVVEVERGSEFGRVVSDMQKVCQEQTEGLNGKVTRLATEGDLKQISNNRVKAVDAMNVCIRKITERKLKMNIVKCEYSFDCSKVIFFFTADGRIDFRGLVKELARTFRVRIELKQIGVRDKAKIVGGYGVCGRELCCSSYMKGFHPLSIKMAKQQNLPLNPSRISGVCGRIKCCMAYEFSVYKDLSKHLPEVGGRVTIEDNKARVIDVNILKRIVIADMGEGRIVKLQFEKDGTSKVLTTQM